MASAEERLAGAEAVDGDPIVENKVAINREEKNDSEEILLRDAIRQIIASCLSFSLVIQVGFSLSYSAVLLPQLKTEDGSLHVSVEQASWIASLVTLMIPVGSLMAGPLMDKYGRRTLSALSGLPIAGGWAVAAFASTPEHLYVSRVLVGLGAGFSTVCLVYCSELTHPTYRPMILGLNSVFVSLGILMTCSLGVNVGWRLQAFIYMILSLMTILLHWLLPESPYWLEDDLAAKRALAWLYRRPHVYLVQLQALLRERERLVNRNNNEVGVRSCMEPIVYKPVLLLTSIFLFQQLSGAYMVIFYAVDVFREIRVQSEDVSLVLFGAIRFLMAVVSLLLSRVVGRRPLLFVSGSGMCFSCFLVFCLRHANVDPSIVEKCVLVYVCFSALGFLGIPWTLIGELFPVKVKGLVSGCMITIAYLFMFGVVKSFPVLLEYVDLKYLFLLFSFDTMVFVMIVYFWLPETFRVSFSEIECHFQR